LRRCGSEQFAHGIDRRCSEAKILRQRVGGAQRHHAERHVGSDEALQNFVRGAVAAASENRIVAVAHGEFGECLGASGCIGFECFGIDAFIAEQRKGAMNCFIALRRMLAGLRVIDQRDSTQRSLSYCGDHPNGALS
jgi:hypothetical protein